MNNQSPKETVLITGANGFIGKELCSQMWKRQRPLRAVLRPSRHLALEVEKVTVEAIDKATDWTQALRDVDAVIHLAGCTQLAVKGSVWNALPEYRSINVEGTLNLARQAEAAGVRRFIFISSIKVNGDHTPLHQPFTAQDQPAPADPYGVSKHEAEIGLQQLFQESGMEIVVIRPPLVYGAGVQGNFLRMLRCLEKGLPLPLGSIRNKRTLVALDNLIDLIMTSIDHPAAANQTFLAGDAEDLSTPELLQQLALAMGKKARLLPVPAWLLNACLISIGRRSTAQKLCGSLRVDTGKTQKLLDWKPPLTVKDALRKTAQAYLRSGE